MPRPAKIWKRKEDGWYYATIDGKQNRLAMGYEEALELFYKLRGEKKGKKKTGRIATTLDEARNAFLIHAAQTKAEKTIENQTAYLESFCASAGPGRRVHDIQPGELDEWAMSQGWGPSTQSSAKRTVMACMNFAYKRKMIVESPFWGIDRGRFQRKERILTAGEKQKIHGTIKGNLADFLHFLEWTGCRPFSEAGGLTASMVKWDEECIPLEKHKNQKKGKRRTIYLAPQALALLRRLAAEYPEGPLFRTKPTALYPAGKEWTRQAATKAMRRIEGRTKIPRLSVYAWRHTYITDCLARNMSPTIVAELVGSSVRTIHRYYSHVDQKKDALREAARKAVLSVSETSPAALPKL